MPYVHAAPVITHVSLHKWQLWPTLLQHEHIFLILTRNAFRRYVSHRNKDGGFENGQNAYCEMPEKPEIPLWKMTKIQDWKMTESPYVV